MILSKRIIHVLLLFVFLSILVACMKAMVNSDVGRQAYVDLECLGCHGPSGKSSDPVNIPSLAGRNADFLIKQLRAFRLGDRKHGIMGPKSNDLPDKMIEEISFYLESL